LVAVVLSEFEQWLVAAWNDGASATELGRQARLTRNAIIGRVHRLAKKGVEIRTRAPATPRVRAPRPPRLPKIKPEPRQIEAPLDPEFAVRVIEARDGHCCWPFGDPQLDEFRYCGRPRFEGHPYCEGHCRDAYQPRQPRRAKEDA